MTRLLRIAAAELRYRLEQLGYLVRPYDVLLDRRRWAWERPGRCGRRVWHDLDPAVQAELRRLAELLQRPEDDR